MLLCAADPASHIDSAKIILNGTDTAGDVNEYTAKGTGVTYRWLCKQKVKPGKREWYPLASFVGSK